MSKDTKSINQILNDFQSQKISLEEDISNIKESLKKKEDRLQNLSEIIEELKSVKKKAISLEKDQSKLLNNRRKGPPIWPIIKEILIEAKEPLEIDIIMEKLIYRNIIKPKATVRSLLEAYSKKQKKIFKRVKKNTYGLVNS